jgi:hypothetical protein
VPDRFQVIRHVRSKFACKARDEITKAPAPSMPKPSVPYRPGGRSERLISVPLASRADRQESTHCGPCCAKLKTFGDFACSCLINGLRFP